MVRSQLLFDAALAVILAGFAAFAARLDVVSTLAAAGIGIAVALRRIAPGIALGVASLIAVVQMLRLEPFLVPDLLIPVVMYGTAAYGTARTRRLGLIAAFAGALVGAAYLLLRLDLPFQEAIRTLGSSTQSRLEVIQRFGAVFLVALAMLLLPWLAGLVARSRTAARTSSRARLIAERDAARADRAVAVEQERVRIAREMHDIVAHSLAVVIAQADGARYALRDSPSAAEDALTTIGATSRRALGDVREMLGALRHEEGSAPTHDASDLARLIGDMRELGVQIRLHQRGDASRLPTTTQLALYRIVQEGLTNAMKHGVPGGPVDLRIDTDGDPMRIEIVNGVGDRSDLAPGTGHGLVGMRERVSMSGGRLSAARVDQTFTVDVALPRPPQVDADRGDRPAVVAGTADGDWRASP